MKTARPPRPAPPSVRPGRRTPVRAAPLAIAALALAAVLAATLWPSATEGARAWDGCLFCGARGLADALLNVALFLPLGASLWRLGLPARAALPACAALSAAVELAQLAVPGRDPSPPDLLFNLLGAALGYAAGRAAARVLAPSDADAARRSLAWSALFAAAVAGTAALTAPSIPASPLYAQWTPEVGGMAVYPGRVVDARVGGAPLRPGRLSAWPRVRDGLRDGQTVEVTFVAAEAPSAPAPLLRVPDARRRQAALLAVLDGSLVVEYRMRAEDLRLDHPAFAAPGALRGVRPGDTVRVSWRRSGRRVEVAVDGRIVAAPALGPGRGWALLLSPPALPIRMARMLDAAWMAAWMVPLGLWLRRRRASCLALAVAAAALAAAPPAGLAPASPGEIVGAAIGLACGCALRRWLMDAKTTSGGPPP